MHTTYEFAIKKDILNSGKINYTPVCREKTRFRLLRSSSWQRITNIYDRFILMDIDWIPEMSYNECALHIKAYQAYLKEMRANEIAVVELHSLEEEKDL